MGQRQQRRGVADQRGERSGEKTDEADACEGTQHRIAWVAASPSLGYASSAGEPPELHDLRRTCAEFEREGYRLISVSPLLGVIDPALGGTGTVGWYLFFLREVDATPSRTMPSRELPDYLRRERVEG